ncbi:ABC transporter ATP-binding protein [Corynebacterium suedekumii]|uniref:ATP-binding cassette domain-containing protein n=1 Tax=Corynebacterium suedekumii TaxID=3049801 RepID=A0ABY8VPI3_9CORY|nr:ATP-binding cassette domain-containing protein [Corynebacterium suedekumii]WIM70926.1 ATP-binding cassette domain-containing protein [Corynebacterium suedekumii]
MTTLELTDVSLTYPDGDSRVTALDHVTMTATAGRMTAVVGESGSGKSSLLSVAAGLISPTTGEARVDGVVVTDDVRRERVGMIFQQANLLASLTVRDQLLVTDHIRGLRGRALRERAGRADELLDRVGLAGLGDRRMGQLSGGQRQRVNIARALMGQPVLLLADEPTAALDARLSRDIVTLLRGLTDDTGVATVMVTHDRSLLDAVDEVVTVADGRVVAEVAN